MSNTTPIINHIIHNSKLEIGQQYKTHLVDDLDGHSVWIKDVEYVDTKGEKKSLDEYFKLPLKRLTIAKKQAIKAGGYNEDNLRDFWYIDVKDISSFYLKNSLSQTWAESHLLKKIQVKSRF